MAYAKSIYIVIPAHNRRELTLACLFKLTMATGKMPFIHIVVVDDGSTDGTGSAIKNQYPEVILLKGDGNMWWSGATNLGLRYALNQDADYVLTMNDDVEFGDKFIERLVETAGFYPSNIICPMVCDPDQRDRVLSAGRYRTGFLGYRITAKYKNRKADQVGRTLMPSELEAGYAMLIPSIVFHETGLFDFKRFPHHMGDMDFVLRARKNGFKVLVDPLARIYGRPGGNYLASFFRNNSLRHLVSAMFDIKSTIYWRTRILFMLRHSIPRGLASIAVLHFLIRMSLLIFAKAVFPRQMIDHMASRLYGKPYDASQ